MRRATAALLKQYTSAGCGVSAAGSLATVCSSSSSSLAAQTHCAAGAAATAALELQRRISSSAHAQALAYEPETLVAYLRQDSGKTAASKIRQRGRTPAIIFSLPGNESKLVELDARQVARQVQHYGRAGAACRIYNVDIFADDHPPPSSAGPNGSSGGSSGGGGSTPPAAAAAAAAGGDANGTPLQRHRVLLRQLHVHAGSDEVENVTLMHCPPDRRVRVDVPVKVIGEDVCPGVRRGGHVNRVMRAVPVLAPGDAVPPNFVVNVSRLDLGGKVELEDLALPPGVEAVVKDRSHPVCKIGGKEKRA